MASFNLNLTSTTAQTLTTNENGVIGPSGFLSVASTSAITLSGSGVDLAILGAVVGLDADPIFGSTTSFSVYIGSDGEVISTSTDAIEIDASSFGQIVNAGTISAASDAVFLTNTDGSATLNILNSGTINAGSSGVFAEGGTGSVRVNNTGTIGTINPTTSALVLTGGPVNVRNSGTIQGDVIVNATSAATIANSGTILGDFDVLGPGTITFRNTGTIHGGINLFGGGTLDTRGGTVTGSITGGEGSNTFYIDRDVTSIFDSGTSGIDTVVSSVTFSISDGIERLALSGGRDIRAFGNITNDDLTGNRGDNRMSGLAGNDTLDGGAGDDTLRGGSGDDVLKLDSGDDVLIGGAGIDTVTLSNLSVATIINLGTGIASSAGSDDDTLTWIENVIGGFGDDTITGSNAANRLDAGNGNDVIGGGNGNDTITGGVGQDTMRGGSGADVFVFATISASTPVFTDLIADFSPAQGDRIDLSAIDPDPGAGSSFAFGGTAFLPEGTASVRVFQDAPNNITVIEARDTTGSFADIRIHLTGLLTLTESNFLL